MSPRTLAILLTACLLLGGSLAQADTPVVYDLGTGTTGEKEFASDETTLELYIAMLRDDGTVGTDTSPAGTACDGGNGDELCGAEITVETSDLALITSFAPIGDLFFDPDPFSATTELSLNLLQSVNPLPPGPLALGTVTITRTGTSESSSLTVQVRGQAVNAEGRLVSIPLRTIALPEPKGGVLLMSGALLLALLYRLRTRRPTPIA